MNNALMVMVVILLLIWLRMRLERRRQNTEWFFCITETRKELNEKIAQAESIAQAAESLQESRGKTIDRETNILNCSANASQKLNARALR